MAKIIELLNEYEIEREEKIDLFNDKEKPLWKWYKDCAWYLTFEPTDNNKMNWEAFSWDTAHSVIISKSYWFIQRLVQNDKIAYDRYIKEFRMKDFGKFYYMSKAEIVIANLSLQDKPVDFLISILK